MFRAQQNAFDDVVAKATDENLTAENWEYILDVCDRVNGEATGAKDAVSSLIKRLAHRNANVQLYTLELANALSQNCGIKLHRELASRAFTDALLRLAGDRNTHQQVKTKILERMSEWADMFKDPDLGIMKDQYWKLKTQNPNLHPPSAPTKSRLTDVDRQKEEEELQMALKLSIQDKASTPSQAQSNAPAQASSSGRDRAPSQSQASAPAQPVAPGTTAATVSRVRALFDFQATDPDELTFRKGDVIAVLESVYKDWWKGLLRGKTGIFPLNYVEKLADPTPEELQREAQMEAEVFGEIKNVEKLLTLLSTSSSDLNVRDNEEITKLYHSTLAIRPKLIELIGKYSQRKDEFTQLNERFIKSCRDYEHLLDASMTQPPQPYQYGQQRHGSQGGYGGFAPQAAPPQQGGPRYFSPHQEPQYPPQQPSSPVGYPPQAGRGGPSAFYANQQQPQYPPDQQGPPAGYQRRDSISRIPSGQQPPPMQTSSTPPNQYASQPQTGHRPESTYANPQELATSVYNSPIAQRTDSAPYSASVYSQEDQYSAGGVNQPPAQQQYTAYVPPALQIQHPSQPPQQQQQPSHDAPPPPTGSAPPPPQGQGGYPSIAPDARNTLPSQGQYKAYQRPGTAEGERTTPSAPPGAPQDFYRQSTAY